MNIIERYLTINPYSRSGKRLAECRGIILHYTGVPGQRADVTWRFFETTCPMKKHYSSAHYIVDLDGSSIHAVPDNETAYHCGTDTKDPATGRVYTDWARQKFGQYASDPTKNSPNNCTIGIELCINKNGEFTPETINAAVELTARLAQENNLSTVDIGHHQLVVGWKNCPLPWIQHRDQFDDFKAKVSRKLGRLF